MRKQIKIVILVSVIFIVILALIIPKARYYLREGDVVMVSNNMEKVEHALESFYKESSGKYPESLNERTEETDKKFSDFLLKENWYEPPILPMWRDRNNPIKKWSLLMKESWYKPTQKKIFNKMVNFKPLMDTIPDRVYPCRICIFTDGARYKIIGGDKNGYLVPEGVLPERGTSKPKIIYSDNYWNKE
ncbi:type II secretion system protein [candidate division WOR-3 bacterium]|nr:type II secretion system protein [candidate division WOR-3 bacterium]